VFNVRGWLSRRERCLDNHPRTLRAAWIGVMQKEWMRRTNAARFGMSPCWLVTPRLAARFCSSGGCGLGRGTGQPASVRPAGAVGCAGLEPASVRPAAYVCVRQGPRSLPVPGICQTLRHSSFLIHCFCITGAGSQTGDQQGGPPSKPTTLGLSQA
jgi:hypothetical protein